MADVVLDEIAKFNARQIFLLYYICVRNKLQNLTFSSFVFWLPHALRYVHDVFVNCWYHSIFMLGLGGYSWHYLANTIHPPLLREHYHVLRQVCPAVKSCLNHTVRGRGKKCCWDCERVARLSYTERGGPLRLQTPETPGFSTGYASLPHSHSPDNVLPSPISLILFAYLYWFYWQ